MRGVSGNNVLNTGAGGAFNQDGILIVPIIDAERVLAIDAKGIDQFKEGEYFSDDLPGLGVNIFFSLNTRGRFTVLLRKRFLSPRSEHSEPLLHGICPGQ